MNDLHCLQSFVKSIASPVDSMSSFILSIHRSLYYGCTIALCILSVIAVQMFNIHVFVSGCIVLNRHPCIKESTGLSFAELSSDSVRCCSSCFNRVARLINSHQTNEQQVSLLSEASDGLYSSLLLLLHLDKTSIWPH